MGWQWEYLPNLLNGVRFLTPTKGGSKQSIQNFGYRASDVLLWPLQALTLTCTYMSPQTYI